MKQFTARLSLLAGLLFFDGLVAQDAPLLSSQKQDAQVPPTPQVGKDRQTGKLWNDNAWARKKAMEDRRGGPPSSEYLVEKNRLLEIEINKWLGKGSFKLPNGVSQGRHPVGVAPLYYPGISWINIGPNSLDSGLYSPSWFDLNSGRPTAIVTHPSDPKILYLASSGGGVWKCTNADVTSSVHWIWNSITDNLPASGSEGNLPIGHLAMDPSDPNTLYFGLGDIKGGGEAVGFWITHDGGSSWAKGWTNLPGPEIYTRQILPLGGGVVLTASYRGLYRSTDGGGTFVRVAGLANPGYINYYPIALIAFSSTDIALGGVTGSSQGWVSKWMYSSDGGATWNDATLDSSITSILAPWAVGLASGGAGDRVAYGLIGDTTTGMIAKGVVRTEDKGRTWNFRPSSQAFSFANDGGQMGYNMFVTVDPTNSSNVFIGADLGSYRSMDGGLSWTPMTNWVGENAVYAHADFHLGAWSKTGPKTLYVGNDGGLSIFRDPLRVPVPSGAGSMASDRSFIDNTRNRGLVNHLVYSVASTTGTNLPSAKNFVLIGMQDNSTGTRIVPGNDFRLDPETGDGQGVLIHSRNVAKAVAASYKMHVKFTTNFGGPATTWQNSSGLPSSGKFYTQIRAIPPNPNGVLTCSADKVYRSLDFGQTFNSLGTSGLSGVLMRTANSYLETETIAVTSAIDATNSASGFVTKDGGVSWTQFGPLPGAKWIWDVDFSPVDPNVLYAVTLSQASTDNHVFKSNDLGATWTALDSPTNGYPFGIPAMVIRESTVPPNRIYVGTQIGVYASNNGGATWYRLGEGQPWVAVEDLYLAPDGSSLRSATFGRGVWELAWPSGLPDFKVKELQLPSQAVLGQNLITKFTISNVGGPAPKSRAKVTVISGPTEEFSKSARHFSKSARHFFKTINIPKLKHNESFTVQINYTIPHSLVPGTYKVQIIADSDHQIRELHERNNQLEKSIQILN